MFSNTVEEVFANSIDYATLQNVYGGSDEPEKRYSPAKRIGCDMKAVVGNPDPKHISASYVERQNWSLGTSLRRMTRFSNGSRRSTRNHGAAIALNYFAYNFIKIHRTLRMSLRWQQESKRGSGRSKTS